VRTTWLGPAHLEEGGEDELDAPLHLEIGVLLDHPACVAHEAHRQGERELPALGLVDEPCGQAQAQGVQLQFRDLAFEAEQQTAIGGGGVIDAVLVCNQTVSEAAKVQQGIPVRAVTREPCDIEREDNADLTERDPGEQALEAFPVLGARGREPEVGIDDLDASFRPPQLYCAASQCILQAQALLMG
jgi:hypothetical protein